MFNNSKTHGKRWSLSARKDISASIRDNKNNCLFNLVYNPRPTEISHLRKNEAGQLFRGQLRSCAREGNNPLAEVPSSLAPDLKESLINYSLANGDVIIYYQTHWEKITPRKSVLWIGITIVKPYPISNECSYLNELLRKLRSEIQNFSSSLVKV